MICVADWRPAIIPAPTVWRDHLGGRRRPVRLTIQFTHLTGWPALADWATACRLGGGGADLLSPSTERTRSVCLLRGGMAPFRRVCGRRNWRCKGCRRVGREPPHRVDRASRASHTSNVTRTRRTLHARVERYTRASNVTRARRTLHARRMPVARVERST
jgi:hypothetical protein